MPKKYVMLVDTERCVNCKACEVSCRAEWNTPLGYSRNWVSEVMAVDPNGMPTLSLLSGRCMHCDSPPCVAACPTGASYKRDDGIVLVDRDLCTGCEFCIDPCPYNARFRDPTDGMISKCTFCQPRIDAGEEPACVHVCFTRALMFGDANDPSSEVARRLAEGTWQRLVTTEVDVGPNLYYSKGTQFDATVLPQKKSPTVAAQTLAVVNPGLKIGLGGMLGLFGAAGVLKLVKRKEEVASHEH
ncbi:MAG: 4Fe-4S dicluster domain-containing protein [Gammaproteobacteria bacterium]|nr:4Fe-4S dicluster domain-containing protein [Gammaproteobacteria bacterium]